MQPDDRHKLATILAYIGELYDKNISKILIEIYWSALQDFELDEVKRAFKTHVSNPDCGRFFPKPADIVRFISGSCETRALLAWTKVEQAIAKVGSYQSVAFDDPLIHAVLDAMGGWISICAIYADKMSYRAHEFQKRYLGYVHQPPCRYPKYLRGIAESENVKAGFTAAMPLLLGNPEQAKQVILLGASTALAVQQLEQPEADLIVLEGK